jgi:BlaI family penicillinase repressor
MRSQLVYDAKRLPMPSRTPRVSDAEFQVLKLLWQEPRLSARQITEALYCTAGSSEIGTVQKLLQRLEGKRLVKRDRSSHVHTFTATVSRAAYAGAQLEQMAEKLTGGSLAPVIMHLVRSKRLRKDELQELRDFLDRHP